MPYYIAYGFVRGACCHKHRSAIAAERCARKDDRACRRHYGRSAYSDRQPTRVTGEPEQYHRERLTEDARRAVDVEAAGA